MKKADPVLVNSTWSSVQKIKIHEQYLKQAITSKNELHQLYGLFFLITDNYNSSNYLAVNDYVLRAELLVSKNKRPDWEAAYHIRKALLFIIKENPKAALQQYFLSYKKSCIAKDSVYMTTNLEQISATYGELDDYIEAEKYFKLALPLLKKFSDEEQLARAYNNYSNLKCFQDDRESALYYIDLALDITHKNNDTYNESIYLNNKAVILTELHQYKEAESLFKVCEKSNLKNNWRNRLINNYFTQALLYEKWGKYKIAIDYYIKQYELKDEVEGIKVNEKMTQLEVKYAKQKKESEAKDNQLKLLNSEKRIAILTLIVILFSILILAVVYLWQKQKKETHTIFIEKTNALNQITTLLFEKNQIIPPQQEIQNTINSGDATTNVFLNKKILTDTDWATFKTYFENAYPNYIKKIRDHFPKITPGEERLFLCIKLKINNKEIASILGISNESVKKNRNRLRKKLNLTIEEDLELFVSDF